MLEQVFTFCLILFLLSTRPRQAHLVFKPQLWGRTAVVLPVLLSCCSLVWASAISLAGVLLSLPHHSSECVVLFKTASNTSCFRIGHRTRVWPVGNFAQDFSELDVKEANLFFSDQVRKRWTGCQWNYVSSLVEKSVFLQDNEVNIWKKKQWGEEKNIFPGVRALGFCIRGINVALTFPQVSQWNQSILLF